MRESEAAHLFRALVPGTRTRLILLSSLLFTCAGHAQPIQKAHCFSTTTCTLPGHTGPGNMLVVIEALPSSTTATVSDEQGDLFIEINTTGWGGFANPGLLWYATGVFGGKVTVNSTAQALEIFLAEYPPAQFDQISSQAFACCVPSGIVGPVVTTSPDELLVEWTIFSENAEQSISAGFTFEDTGGLVTVQDAEVAPGSYSATITTPFDSQHRGIPWGARIVAFKLIGPAFSKYKAPYSPIQVKTCPSAGNGYVAPCQFDASVAQGNMLVVVGNLGCSPVSGCNSVSDSQSNNWSLAVVVPNDNGVPLWYALDAKGGSDTIYFAVGTGQNAIIAEYPPSLGLEDANYGTFADPNFHQPNGDQTHLDVTRAIATRSQCDLLISWGLSGASNMDVSPGPNFTIRAYYDVENLALEDATSRQPGAYIGSIFWSDFADWLMGVAAFNMNGCKNKHALENPNAPPIDLQ